MMDKESVLLMDLRHGLCSSGLCKQLRSVAAEEIQRLQHLWELVQPNLDKLVKLEEEAASRSFAPPLGVTEAARVIEGNLALRVENERLTTAKANLMHALAAKQAKIDALMLEYCPGEMSPQQKAEWAAHQVPSDEPSEVQVAPHLDWHDVGCVKRYGAESPEPCACEKRRAEKSGDGE